MGANPMVLCLLIGLASLMLTLFNYNHALHRVPIWWDLQANPWIYGPRWLGMLFLPFLTVLVPCALYKTVSNDDLDSHGYESKNSVLNIVILTALYLFTIQMYVIVPADIEPKHIFPARSFVANTALWLLLYFGHNIKDLESNMVVGIINPWTTDNTWEKLHSRASLVFEISGVLLFIAAFVVPIGWPLLVTLLVLWLGPWLVSYGLAYSYESSSSIDEPLLNNN